MAAAQALVGQTPATLATTTTGTRRGNTSNTSKPTTTSAAPPPPKRRRVEGTVLFDFLLGVWGWGWV